MERHNNKMLCGKAICVLLLISVLFINGCSGGQYEAEKLYWKANKSYVSLLKDPESAKPGDYKKVILAYRKVIVKFPVWKFSSKAQLVIGQLYAMQDNMSQAMIEFEKVLEDFPKDGNACASALFSIGKIYESRDDWNKALGSYRKIMSDYKNTYAAYQVPIYIAQYYKSKNMHRRSEEAYKKAVEGYEKIIDEHPDTFAGFTAQRFIIMALVEQKKWVKASEYLLKIADSKSGTPLAVDSLCKVVMIYQVELGQSLKAEDVYEKALKEYEKVIEGQRKMKGAYQKALEEPEKIKDIYKLKDYIERSEKAGTVSSLKSIAGAAISLKKWEDAIRYFRELADFSPKALSAAESLNAIAGIYQNQLNQPQKAIEAYEEMLEKFPNIKAAKLIEEKIESLRESEKE